MEQITKNRIINGDAVHATSNNTGCRVTGIFIGTDHDVCDCCNGVIDANNIIHPICSIGVTLMSTLEKILYRLEC